MTLLPLNKIEKISKSTVRVSQVDLYKNAVSVEM